MLILVALMAHGHDPSVSRIQLDPAVWWYVARASGLLALALLGASVMGGLLLSTRLARGHTRTWTQGLHEFIGAFAVVFTVIHLACVLAADELRTSLRELLVPFARPDNPVAQGCGVLAFYLLLTAVLTSWTRALLPWRLWRRVHLLTFPLFALACAHTVLAGSDTTNPILHWASLAAGVVIVFLVVVRLLTARVAGTGPAAPVSTGPVATPASLDPPRPTTSAPAAATATVGTEMRLLITQTTWEADNVLSLRLHSPEGTALPTWEPGAHIELALPSGRRRQYSLCGDPNDTGSYRIAILQVAEGRGGSVEAHTRARAGQLLSVQGPQNHFPLVPSPAYLFIAGGIGITAVLAMTARVAATGAQWKLVYTGRRRTGMAFIDELLPLDSERVDIVPTNERGRPNLGKIIGAAAPGTAVYCCGPDRLLREVRERVTARPDLSLHSERFTGTPTTGGAGFYVELRRTGRIIKVPANRTVLQAVRDVVPAVSAGCEQGTCGMCRTTVLAGEPDHRDQLLNSAEHAAGQMLICVSRARNERLVLDL
ncbi:MAG: 2Fe-2S iron-sulfur cluster-binding protein [Actinomycetota bacterium]|nr:2Fe-2S iron-sulfur cluster-binding protein [Actinomycetota bacterium]